MKNMKLISKFILCFSIALAMIAVIGAVGILGLKSTENSLDTLYQNDIVAIEVIGNIKSNFISQRVYLRDIVINDSQSDNFKNAVTGLDSLDAEMNGYFTAYEASISNDEDKSNFELIKTLYSDYAEVKKVVIETGQKNDTAGALVALNKGSVTSEKIQTLIDSSVSLKHTECVNTIAGDKASTNRVVFITVIIAIMAAVGCVFFALLLANGISKPVRFLADTLKEVAETGNIRLDEKVAAYADNLGKQKDEVGEIAAAVSSLLGMLNRKVIVLEKVAGGNLGVKFVHRSVKDTFSMAIQKMVDTLDAMFREIVAASNQVATGSQQLANGSQTLAQGSTQQAASVQQLSASISEVSAKTGENAEKANRAARLGNEIKANAEHGSMQMDQMINAVKDISAASDSISKVIKVIDDIAFQTNILALNAAVEAARAGQHGKGFAVVAEEVRNLAAKSAEAAKDTGALIANSIQKAELGVHIADETAASLSKIVAGIEESSAIVNDIARSSDEQTSAIKQIDTGIEQVSQVVMQNSATAEQSASASSEMSGQSSLLQELIGRFKLKDDIA